MKNTKIIWYLTHTTQGSFEKVIIETIIPAEIYSTDEAIEWIDSYMGDVMDELDIQLVFTSVVLKISQTTDETIVCRMLNAIPGKLVFKGDEKSEMKGE